MSNHSEELPVEHFKNAWTTGTILASGTSIISLLTMVGSIIWFSARADATLSTIPTLQKQQELNTQAIQGEAIKQSYTDSRYMEIQAQLANIQTQLQAIQRSNNDRTH